MMLRDRTAPRATVSGLTPPKLALPVGPDSYDLAQAELDRIRTLLNRMSAKKLDTVSFEKRIQESYARYRNLSLNVEYFCSITALKPCH